ncbi:MAG: tail completion protein gp17, partial [Methylococcales bacterium]
VVAPYLTWSCLAGIPEICLDEPPDIDRMTIQVNCWARTGEEVRELADAVRDVLEIVGHVTNIIMDSRDFETKLYWIGIEMDWLYHRQ